MPTSFQHHPQIPLSEAPPKIRQAMRAGNIGDAVIFFLQTGEKESIPLFEKFSEAREQFELKRLGLEAWGRTQAQICESILGTSGMVETEMSENPSAEIKAKILQLLHSNKTEQALALCEGFGDQYLLLEAQLYTAKNQCSTGLIESEYFEATKSKINYAMLEMMGQTPDYSVPSRSLMGKLRNLFK